MKQCMLLAIITSALGCSAPAVRDVQIDCEAIPPLQTWQECLASIQQVLDKHRKDDDLFDYAAFLADTDSKNRLRAVLCFAGDYPASELTTPEKRLEFYLNMHNACAIQAACEHYPFTRWKEIKADWKEGLRFRIAGENLTLADMEQRCAPQEDWRIPFALSGPSLGSPPLSGKVYQAQTLPEQLDLAVQRYFGGCAGIQVDYARKRVLFGDRIWNQRSFFLEEYRKKYGVQPGLVSAVIPWAPAKTQTILSDLPGYGSGRLPENDWLNDVERDPKTDPQKPEKPEFLPCGCR